MRPQHPPPAPSPRFIAVIEVELHRGQATFPPTITARRPGQPDAGYYAPSTVAYAVDADSFDRLRTGVKAVLTTGSPIALCALWERQRAPFIEAWRASRWEVSASVVRDALAHLGERIVACTDDLDDLDDVRRVLAASRDWVRERDPVHLLPEQTLISGLTSRPHCPGLIPKT